MTTDHAAVRPYSVFVRVLHEGDFDHSVRLNNYVDRGLSPSEIDSLGSLSDAKKLALTSLTRSPLMSIVLGALAAWGVTQWGAESAVGGAAWWTVTVALVAAIAWSIRTRKTITARQELLKNELIGAGRLANPHERRSDLRRIDAALRVLQELSGTSFDELARRAVLAVLDQDINAPSRKAITIAESKSDDPHSTAIRARVLAQTSQSNADIAKAELLILELEQLAAKKNPRETVTAD